MYIFANILWFCFRLIGFIPSNYVKEKELLGLQQYEYVLIFLLPLFGRK